MACRACDRSSSSIDVRHNHERPTSVYELPFGAGKQFLTGRLGVPGPRRLGTGRHRERAHGTAGEHHDVAKVRRSAGRQHFQSTAESGSRRTDLCRQPDDSTTGSIPAAFSLPANGTWGNLGRYIANGPGMYEIDTSLQKRFPITERLALNFRASAYNLLNHPVYTESVRQHRVTDGHSAGGERKLRTNHKHHQHRSRGNGRAPPLRVHVPRGVLRIMAKRILWLGLIGILLITAAAAAGCRQKDRRRTVRGQRDGAKRNHCLDRPDR